LSFDPQKNRGEFCFSSCFAVYRFLSSIIANPIAIATIMAPVEPRTYSPVGSCGGGGVGVGIVSDASWTFIAVSAREQ